MHVTSTWFVHVTVKLKSSLIQCHVYSECLLCTYVATSVSVSRSQSARRMPTYEHPTSYYCLASEMAPPNSIAPFSPDGLTVSIQKTNVMNLLPGSIQLNVHASHS